MSFFFRYPGELQNPKLSSYMLSFHVSVGRSSKAQANEALPLLLPINGLLGRDTNLGLLRWHDTDKYWMVS